MIGSSESFYRLRDKTASRLSRMQGNGELTYAQYNEFSRRINQAKSVQELEELMNEVEAGALQETSPEQTPAAPTATLPTLGTQQLRETEPAQQPIQSPPVAAPSNFDISTAAQPAYFNKDQSDREKVSPSGKPTPGLARERTNRASVKPKFYLLVLLLATISFIGYLAGKFSLLEMITALVMMLVLATLIKIKFTLDAKERWQRTLGKLTPVLNDKSALELLGKRPYSLEFDEIALRLGLAGEYKAAANFLMQRNPRLSQEEAMKLSVGGVEWLLGRAGFGGIPPKRGYSRELTAAERNEIVRMMAAEEDDEAIKLFQRIVSVDEYDAELAVHQIALQERIS